MSQTSLPERPLRRELERAALAAEIVTTYARARRAMRRADIRDALAHLRSVRPDHDGPVSIAAAARLGRAVDRTLRLLPTDSRCLVQSLVLTTLLARRATDATVVIGVRTATGLDAHAWVEVTGRPVLPSGGEAYARLVEL